MTIQLALIAVLVLLLAGAVGTVSARRPIGRNFVYLTSLLVCATLVVASLLYLLRGAHAEVESLVLPIGLPWLGAHVELNLIAAMFLLVVNLGGASASLYGLGYGSHEQEPGRVVPIFPVFLAAMNLVVLAADAFSFLLSWEFMSLSSWALVMAHHRDPDNRRAGFVYLVMASFGTLSLLLAFGLLAGPDGGYAFADMRLEGHESVRTGIVFCLVLIGCGSKAGIVPLHAWLPLAHPAAPSHVSALMSGVMTKVAVYGFVRIVFDLLGPPQTWWSVVVLSVGAITALMGVLHALMQHDLKRLLAYHTVENIGIIFIGLGLALAFESDGLNTAAALAFVAALFHVFNHSLFKSLLFYGAGAVLTATGERNMDRLGGLTHRMPITAFTFLVGSMAISALPPLNGFVSEWLTFQAILISPQLGQWGLKFLIPAVGAMLALSAALAAACFVKAYGMTFLGRPRSAAAETPVDAHPASLAAMIALVALCLLAGIAPGYVIDAITPVTDLLRWWPHTTSSRSAMAHDRADRADAQFVQRLHPIPVHGARRRTRRVHDSPVLVARDPPRTAVGLRLSGSQSRHAIHRRQFRSADPARVRHAAVPGARTRRHAAPRRSARRAFPCRHPRSDLGVALRTPRQGSPVHRDVREPVAVADDPAIPRTGIHCARQSPVAAGVHAMIRDYVLQAGQLLLTLLLAPLLTGFIRKVKARLMQRQGPPLLQPYRDLIKLSKKEVVLADNASWLFRVAPYLIFSATWTAAALVPTFATGLPFSRSVDLLAIVALLGSARFFLALVGLDVGTSFGGIGASREVMIASLAEPALIVVAFTLALIAGSTQLSEIAAFMTSGDVGLRVSLGLALGALIIVAIAENARIPVDNPATHLELTMVHEAMVLEYSGRHLAVLELASSLKLLLYVALIAAVFVPWGLATSGAPPGHYVIGVAAFLAKVVFAGALLALFETTIAKMRVFRVPEFLGISLMLALLAALLMFVTRSL